MVTIVLRKALLQRRRPQPQNGDARRRTTVTVMKTGKELKREPKKEALNVQEVVIPNQ